MDSPIGMQNPRYSSPECTSTPVPPAKTDKNTYVSQTSQQLEGRRKSEGFETALYSDVDNQPLVYNRPRTPVYCQSSNSVMCKTQDSVVTKSTANSNQREKAQRCFSSDNILGDSESGYGSGNQGGYGARDREVWLEYNSSADTPPFTSRCRC